MNVDQKTFFFSISKTKKNNSINNFSNDKKPKLIYSNCRWDVSRRPLSFCCWSTRMCKPKRQISTKIDRFDVFTISAVVKYSKTSRIISIGKSLNVAVTIVKKIQRNEITFEIFFTLFLSFSSATSVDKNFDRWRRVAKKRQRTWSDYGRFTNQFQIDRGLHLRWDWMEKLKNSYLETCRSFYVEPNDVILGEIQK